MFDLLGLLRYLPAHKAFDLARFLPLAFEALKIVVNVDANHDGVLDGAEKLSLAKKLYAASLQALPKDLQEKLRNASPDEVVEVVQRAWDLLAAIKALFAPPPPGVPIIPPPPQARIIPMVVPGAVVEAMGEEAGSSEFSREESARSAAPAAQDNPDSEPVRSDDLIGRGGDF